MSIAPTLSNAKTGGRDDWQTPEVVLERVRRLGAINLDPCTTEDNPTGAGIFMTAEEDGLSYCWADEIGDGRVYCNPPYSAAERWLEKCVDEAANGCEVVALIAARPGTLYWFKYVWGAAVAVAFWKGRIRFVGADNNAPFESALVYYGRRPDVFDAAFRGVAKVVRL